jgi:hypothetical protein
MQIELQCTRCPFHFDAPADADADEILDRMTEEGPWIALGRGDTFEAMVFAALTARGWIGCPDCGRAVSVSERDPWLLTERTLAGC